MSDPLSSAFAIVRSSPCKRCFLAYLFASVVVSGKARPTQQEFNKLTTTLGITSQAVRGLRDIKPLQDSTLTLLLSPMIQLIPLRRTVLERGADVTAQDEHALAMVSALF